MQTNKPTRNNPNPVPFKIKNEPHSSTDNRENNSIVNKYEQGPQQQQLDMK